MTAATTIFPTLPVLPVTRIVPRAPSPVDPSPAPLVPGSPRVVEERGVVEARSEFEELTAALFERIALTGPEERAALVQEVVVLNLPLADAMSRRFRHRGEEDDDLLQVARSGLTEAVLRYQSDRGPFVGFAVPTILGVLKRHFRDRGWMVRPPRRQQEVVLSIRRAWPELTQQLGSEPTDADLAEHLGETTHVIAQARQAEQGYRPVALDLGPTDHWSGAAADQSDVAACEARLLVGDAFAALDPADRRLVWMRFYQERTQSDIAAELGTSQMQVSRLLTRVMGRMRRSIGSLEDQPSSEPARRGRIAPAQSSTRSQVQISGAPRSST